MSTKSNTQGKSLTEAQIKEVNRRVAKVCTLVKRSATVWLDVSKEFSDAKKAFGKSKLAFQRFHTDAGFTHSVADKLTLVGECKPLHTEKYKPIANRTDGWSTLYELTKLHQQDKLGLVLEHVEKHPDMSVTRSVVQNLLNEKAAAEKTLVLAKFIVPESAFNKLSKDELKSLHLALCQASALLSSAPECVQLLPIEQTVKKALGGVAPQTSVNLREAMKLASAQALAHVQETELSQLAPAPISEAERRELNDAAFQFNTFQCNVRREEVIAEIANLKSQDRLSDYDKKTLKRLEASVASGSAAKMPYDPKSEVSIEHLNHRFSVNPNCADRWSYGRFFNYIRENNILLELDGIPERSEYAKASCAAFGKTALTGTPAERKASEKALSDIVAGETRANARGTISKAPIAREVLSQINGATSQ